MPCASLSPPPSPSPVKGEGIEEGESLPEIALRPDDVYVVGIYGSQGRGKTVTALALVSVLTRLLYFAISGVNVILLGPIPSSG